MKQHKENTKRKNKSKFNVISLYIFYSKNKTKNHRKEVSFVLPFERFEKNNKLLNIHVNIIYIYKKANGI